MKHAVIADGALKEWLQGEDISCWFSEATQLQNILSYEEMFYDENGNCRVTGTNVF